jgi:anti-sigma regulatory factor (Ser/Thr protein kinase)
MGEIELEIPARPEFLSLARQVVAAAATVEPRFGAERIDDLRVAASEAITNAVEAHAEVLGGGRIWVRCDLDAQGDCIRVEVHDSAGGFDPESVPSVPDPDDPDRLGYEHGLGIPIMRQLADETEIRTTESGTTVELTVYRTAAAASEHLEADPPS